MEGAHYITQKITTIITIITIMAIITIMTIITIMVSQSNILATIPISVPDIIAPTFIQYITNIILKILIIGL